MQDTDLQEIITQEKDNETAEADKIKYQDIIGIGRSCL